MKRHEPSHASTSSFVTLPTEINERGVELEILGAADRNFQTFSRFVVHFASSTMSWMEVEEYLNMNRQHAFITQPYNGLKKTAHEIIIFGKAPRRRMKYHPSYHSPILAIHGPRPATLRCLECHVGE